jgi:hypothetical protein
MKYYSQVRNYVDIYFLALFYTLTYRRITNILLRKLLKNIAK